MRPHCRHVDACKAKTPDKHCGPCQSASPETRAKRSASAKAYLDSNPEERQRRSLLCRAHSADPAILAKRGETLARIARTPEMREMQRQNRLRILRERKDDPAFIEALREQGRRVGRHNLLVGLTHEVRARAAPKIKAAHLAWCPPEYWEMNALLKRKGFLLDDRKEMIAAEIVRSSPQAKARGAIFEFDRRQRERYARELADTY